MHVIRRHHPSTIMDSQPEETNILLDFVEDWQSGEVSTEKSNDKMSVLLVAANILKDIFCFIPAWW